MTKDHTQLAIENGAIVTGYAPKYIYQSEDSLNATIEAAIKQAFDEAEVGCYEIYWDNREWIFTKDRGDIDDAKKHGYIMRPLIAKRVDK